MSMITNSQFAFFSCVLSGPVAFLKSPALQKESKSVMTIPLANVYIGTLCKNPLHLLSYLANRRVVLKLKIMQSHRRKTSKSAHTQNVFAFHLFADFSKAT
jgi:hypothetical protein